MRLRRSQRSTDNPSARSPADPFLLPAADFEPAYMALHRSGELRRRAKEAVNWLRECTVCPRNCGVDRIEPSGPRKPVCKTNRYARVASHFAHFGEEDCLRGWNGSGTVFFAWCNLRCVFCQNFDVSQEPAGHEAPPERLAQIMLSLQEQGCHNINFVTPEHVVPQILEALPLAVERGLRLPIVYNTSAYDSLHSLHLLDGIVDIYMPDFKLWDDDLSLRYLKARDYPAAARQIVREMHRQVGPLKLDEKGLARRGLLVRHLIMPGLAAEGAHIMRFLAEELSPDTYVNVMTQYRPAGKVSTQKYDEINRAPGGEDYRTVLSAARNAGLWRFDERRPRWPF